jgi:hypothetical protein
VNLGLFVQSFGRRNRGVLLRIRGLDIIFLGNEVAEGIAGVVVIRGVYTPVAIVVTKVGATNIASTTHDKGNVR